MSRELPLQEKLRRSEVLSEEDIYKDFMDYAKEVRDELEVYLYMEENNIGTDQVEYWLARFRVMRSRCQLVSLVELIQKVKCLQPIQDHRRRIQEYEFRLFNEFKTIIYSTFQGKRKTSSFSKLRNCLHPQIRKIGNIEVYVEERYRHNQYLQDFSKYIQEEMKTYSNIEREDYFRMQARKPPSFLAKKEEHLMRLADQLLSNNRRSLVERKSVTNNRFSNHLNIISKDAYKDEDYQTPKNVQPQITSTVTEKVKNQPENVQRPKTKTKGKSNSDISRDSVQILREMREKQLEFNSPKFKLEGSHFKKDPELEMSFPIEKCRLAPREEQLFGFSFGKHAGAQSEEKQKQKRRYDNEQKDNAFIAYSFSQDNTALDKTSSFVKPQDFQLQLLIYDIQREKYDRMDSQTFSSEIDSNQENKDYEERFTNNKNSMRYRKPFELLLETDNNHNEGSSLKLEQLVEFDDDEKNPEVFMSEKKNQASQHLNPFAIFLSEQKRLSNITEEGSYFSESKNKHSSRRI